MVDMKNTPSVAVWENCSPSVSEAIRQFEQRWHPYSISSRRYPIIRLIEELIDPVVTEYMATLPARYSAYVSGAGSGVSFSAITKLVGLDAMVRVQRQLLRQFIKTEDRQDARDQRFVATLESLIELVWDCACKRPKNSAPAKGVNLNGQRKNGFCDLCGELTEFADFTATVADGGINDIELEEHKKLELSHQYCTGHRPKRLDGEWNPAYRQAKRSQEQFNLELARLSRQCAKRAKPQAASGCPLVDDYFHIYMLSQTIQPADQAALRNQARFMVGSKLSDRKKQMLVLQHYGLSQSAIGRRLGIGRQAISKALASIPEALHLKR
ncbi:LuxR family transcriptional regulator [Pseudomonas mangiferae]|uniref:LuxR family transcriptional regulator n=1 Tax=Pseudomonas mangiferae TaxID=2593654 RepID=A0A553H3Q5_9PSED|nr:LuxR family transcriptional regulator [Pseudomonas mangiferae]TRX76396.1 LuxR family transcriptional regulator [Pseudomonas mangiferae]